MRKWICGVIILLCGVLINPTQTLSDSGTENIEVFDKEKRLKKKSERKKRRHLRKQKRIKRKQIRRSKRAQRKTKRRYLKQRKKSVRKNTSRFGPSPFKRKKDYNI